MLNGMRAILEAGGEIIIKTIKEKSDYPCLIIEWEKNNVKHHICELLFDVADLEAVDYDLILKKMNRTKQEEDTLIERGVITRTLEAAG